MTVSTRLLPFLLLPLLAAGCGSTPAEPDTAAAEAPGTPAFVDLSEAQIAQGGIDVATVQPMAWTEWIEAPAVVVLDEQRTARVGALLDARVEDVEVEVGDAVRRGTVLADLHSHVTHDIVAMLRKAVSGKARLESELAYARAALARAERLLADGAASAQEVERASTTLAGLERELEMASADETRARAELRHYGVDLVGVGAIGADGHADDRMPVRAPQAGVVLERLVTPGTAVISGQPLFVVSDLSRLWVMAEVDERVLSHLTRGGNADLRVQAYPDETFAATVTYIGDVIAADTRRVQVRAEVANGDRRLKPQMYATLRLPGIAREVLAVPADAVQRLDGRDVVFVEESPRRFVPRAVQTAPMSTDGPAAADAEARVAIVDGLEAGARVVTRGAFLVRSELQKATMAEEE